MANAPIVSPSQGTYDIFNNVQEIRAVMGGADWSRYFRKATWFATMMSMGRYDFTGNAKIDIVLGGGAPRKFTTGADIDTTSATTVTWANLAGVNDGDIVPGDVIKFSGEDTVLYVTDTNSTTVTFVVKVVNTTGGTAAGTVDSGAVGFWYSAAEYDGSAPESVNYTPNYTQNYMQMFRRSWGKGYVDQSQNTIFNNSIEYLGMEMTDKMLQEVNNALLFSAYGAPVASGSDYGITRGLPYWLDLANAGTFTAEEDQAIVNVDPGTSFTDFGLKRYADRFTQGSGVKDAIMSNRTLTNIDQAMTSTSSTVVYRKTDLEIPGFHNDGWLLDLGEYQFKVIVDRNMANIAHVFKGTRVDETDTTVRNAAQDYTMLVVDPEFCKIAYHINKRLGVMSPRVFDVHNTRNLHKDEKEVKAALTLGMHRLAAHGAYGVSGS